MAKKTRLPHAARLKAARPHHRVLSLLVLGPGLALAAPPAGEVRPPPASPAVAPAPARTAAAGSSADAASALSSTTASSSASPASLGGVAGSKAHRGSVGCLIGPERTAEIGSPVTGVVASIRVERGDEIRRGQVLATLEQGVEQANVQAAQARSGIDAEVRSAEASLALARERFDRMNGLRDSGAIAALTVDQARAERDVAEQRLAQARDQRKVMQQELGVAQAQLAQRNLRAPFDGVVVDRLVQTGERVEDKPLLRVAQLDPLRVELVMPATRWGSVNKGDALAVVPELPGADKLLARVTHIDRMLDAASNTFRVRLSLPNPGHRVPAGARCKLDGPGADGVTPPAGSGSSAQGVNISQAPAQAPAAAAPAAVRPASATPVANIAPAITSPAAGAGTAAVPVTSPVTAVAAHTGATPAAIAAAPVPAMTVTPTRWKPVSKRWLATARKGLGAKVVPDAPVYAPAPQAPDQSQPAPRLLFTV